MSVDFLLEIGCEEIPASYLEPAVKQMKQIASVHLLSFDGIEVFYTPRRLILYAKNVAEKQPHKKEEKMGPAKSVAYDEQGNPTKAAEGFARGQGVSVNELYINQTAKGEYVFAKKKSGGNPTIEILPGLCKSIIDSICFPKSMRWEESGFRFARPIRWILALLGGEVVKFQVADVTSGDFTFGHRFLSSGKLTVKNTADYFKKMEEAYVIVDPKKRRQIIEKQLTALAQKHQIKVDLDKGLKGLLEETANLTEYPVVGIGRFDEKFLHVPTDVLITAMKKHQKYFPFTDNQGQLQPYFASVNNLPSAGDEDLITKGNEMVLKARLSDAQFFFIEDCKTVLDKRTEDLKQVVFQVKLGTLYEKCRRLENTSLYLGKLLQGREATAAARAALLCKTDLLTNMVYEFPELQGVMGREYALRSNEEQLVAQAIYEHYLPRFNGDDLPQSEAGALLSLAEKLDNIVGCLAVGLTPSGSQDPYGLRRQALGVTQIILQFNYRLSLRKVIYHLVSLLLGKINRNSDEVVSEVLDFLKLRLQFILESEKVAHDIIKAVLIQDNDDFKDMYARAKVIQELRKETDFNSMMISYRRVVNILRGASGRLPKINQKLMEHQSERELDKKMAEIKDKFLSLVDENMYAKAFAQLKPLQPYIDDFFDQVMVMVEDASLRENRFALLGEIANLFSRLADFSQIVIA